MSGKRGCNYTADEKQILVDLIKKNINILESKKTNGDIIRQKRECWRRVAEAYNSLATTGPRTWAQLRHLYENIKQKTKKNVATENKQNFLKKDKNDALIKASYDKKQINKTGGGPYKTVLTDTDNKILAMVATQIKPMQNPYDDAAEYFDDYVAVYCDDSTVEIVGNTNLIEPQTLMTEKNGDSAVEIVKNRNLIEPEETTSSFRVSDARPVTLTTKINDKTKLNTAQKRTKLNNNIKEQYFKTKLVNARLEKRFMIQKHKLEIELLKIKINRFKK